MGVAGRTSTPAARRRAAQRAAARNGHGRSPKSTPSKRTAPGRPAARRAPSKKRAPATRAGKRPAAKRPAGTRPSPKRRAGAKVSLRRPSLRASLIVLLVAGAALVAGYYGWLRDSSLVAVRDVSVSGVTSPDRERIEAALTDAARTMTTLNVREDELAAAVASFPTVLSVSADAKLLHGLAVEVAERPPVLIVEGGGETVPVAGDGTLLRGLELGKEANALPALEVKQIPGSGGLEGADLEQALVLGATPAPLRPLIEGVSFERKRGVELTMKGGIPILFGPSSQAAQKWGAAATVLADPKLETLTYVDVRVPERPAVGGAAAPTALEPDPEPAPVEPTL